MDRQSWLRGTLYSHASRQDSCGFGLIAQMDNKPSHWLVSTAINSLACLTHRGAVAADGKSGDGCDLLFRKPDSFLRAVAAEQGITLAAQYAAGLVFHADEASLVRLREAVESQGLAVADVRTVPTNVESLWRIRAQDIAAVQQVFVNCPEGMDELAFERKLYQARRL